MRHRRARQAAAEGLGQRLANVNTNAEQQAVNRCEVQRRAGVHQRIFRRGIEAPFGGNPMSGFGREKGLVALCSYSKVKSVAARI